VRNSGAGDGGQLVYVAAAVSALGGMLFGYDIGRLAAILPREDGDVPFRKAPAFGAPSELGRTKTPVDPAVGKRGSRLSLVTADLLSNAGSAEAVDGRYSSRKLRCCAAAEVLALTALW
jgi:hypothetical protein